MAVFLLKSKLGSGYAPPACSGAVFLDVPCTGGLFDPWIEDLAARGITGGCGAGNYCPGSPVTRAQMAALLLKTDLGSGYAPARLHGNGLRRRSLHGGIFDPWIEDLAARGITGGCGAGVYCPGAAATRGQMARVPRPDVRAPLRRSPRNAGSARVSSPSGAWTPSACRRGRIRRGS